MAIVIKEEHNLSNWLSSLTSESTWLHKAMLAEFLLAIILIFSGLVLFFVNGKIFLLVLAGVTIFLAVGHWVKQYENYRSANFIKAGRLGEQLVSDAFENELDDNAILINDVDIAVSGYKSQIDHIIVGPRGIYVIETKSWGGRLVGTEDGETWAQIKSDKNGKEIVQHLKSPIKQNNRHLKTLKKALEARSLSCTDIFSVIIITRKRTILDVKSTTPVLKIDDAVDYIARNCPSKEYNAKEITAYVEAILPGYHVNLDRHKYNHG